MEIKLQITAVWKLLINRLLDLNRIIFLVYYVNGAQRRKSVYGSQ